MWVEEFKNKHGKKQYRFYERYKDPLTNKTRRTSVIMNKDTKQSQKEAQKRLNERIDNKIKSSETYVPAADELAFHLLIDEWFEKYKLASGSKRSTIKTKYSKINTIKKYTPNDGLAKSVNSKVLQDFVNKLVENNYSQKIIQDFFSLVRNILKFGQKKYKLNNLRSEERRVGKECRYGR